MSEDTSTAAILGTPEHGWAPAGCARLPAAPSRYRAWLPSWGLITAKHLELRKRRGVMLTVVLLTLALPVLVLGFRLAFHLFDPKSYGPAGTPATFQSLINPIAEFGFIVAAVLGATAGTSDLTEGMFRHLVITGRSRVALYLSRIPAGLAIILPLVALAFTLVCLVTSYEGVPQPTSIGVTTSFPAPSGGPGSAQAVSTIAVPASLSQAQLESWLVAHPQRAGQALALSPQAGTARIDAAVHHQIGTFYTAYASQETSELNPPANEMFKIGLWLELEVGVGFLVGLGLGSLIGQRTMTVIVMIALEIILTPIFAATAIPYFLNGQRLDVGIALDQLRPAGLASGAGRAGGPGHVLFGGRGVLNIPPMPTWAMISVIVGWIVGWSVIGAWRMATRDA
jgi:ABC-type transport system involved in multi-copper enzyme maturation permease subunit